MIVRELMKTPLIIDSNIDLNNASRLMTKHDIGSIIVMSKDKISGIITQEDLVKNFGKGEMVYDVMSKNVVTIREDEEIAEAFKIVKKSKISVLPVLDSKGNLVGVVNIKDLISGSEDGEEFIFN